MSHRGLVIGSEGNIGAPLVQHLKAAGYDVLESDIRPGWRDRFVMADVNHPVDLLPAFDWRPDVVFLLSAIGTSLMAHTENRRFAAPIVPLVMMSGVTALDSIRRRARGAQA